MRINSPSLPLKNEAYNKAAQRCGAWRRGEGSIFIDGRHVALVSAGEGKDVLFLHGYMSCKESFYYNIEDFKGSFRVTAPDFPGFGASAPLGGAWSVGDYCEWLKKFIYQAGLKRPHIVAHSFGARVAIKLAAGTPGLVDKLIITGGAGLVKPRTRAYKRRVAAYRFVKRFAPNFAENRFGSKEYRQLSPIMRESYKKIVNEDLRGDAAKIAARTLLIYGADDAVTPAAEEGRTFCQCIARSELKIIAGGHFCFCENYQEFNQTALAFLLDGGGRGR